MLKFAKYQATGNDFIIINGIDKRIENPLDLTKRLCDRHFGIGADGLIIVRLADEYYYMDYYNQDGTNASICGNGLRAFSQYLLDQNLINAKEFTLKTKAGLKKIKVNPLGAITVNLGTPLVKAVNTEVRVENKIFFLSIVDSGNPHGVIFGGDIETMEIARYAPQIAVHPKFPEGVNVHFSQVLDKENIKIISYERGSGFTLSCGTGVASSFVVGEFLYQLKPRVTFHCPGGEVVAEKINNEVLITASASLICEGTYFEERREING